MGPRRHPTKRSHRNSDPTAPITKSTPVNPIKSKIHDVTRLLQHAEHLPADVRVEKERELEGYKHDLEKIEEEKRKQHLIKRYHMVRFFGWLTLGKYQNECEYHIY